MKRVLVVSLILALIGLASPAPASAWSPWEVIEQLKRGVTHIARGSVQWFIEPVNKTERWQEAPCHFLRGLYKAPLMIVYGAVELGTAVFPDKQPFLSDETRQGAPADQFNRGIANVVGGAASLGEVRYSLYLNDPPIFLIDSPFLLARGAAEWGVREAYGPQEIATSHCAPESNFLNPITPWE